MANHDKQQDTKDRDYKAVNDEDICSSQKCGPAESGGRFVTEGINSLAEDVPKQDDKIFEDANLNEREKRGDGASGLGDHLTMENTSPSQSKPTNSRKSHTETTTIVQNLEPSLTFNPAFATDFTDYGTSDLSEGHEKAIDKGNDEINQDSGGTGKNSLDDSNNEGCGKIAVHHIESDQDEEEQTEGYSDPPFTNTPKSPIIIDDEELSGLSVNTSAIHF
jgi:hypothetical protein